MKRKRRTQVFPPVPRIFEPNEKYLTKTKKNKTKQNTKKNTKNSNKQKKKLLISFQLFGLFFFFISERENAGDTFLIKPVKTIYFIR